MTKEPADGPAHDRPMTLFEHLEELKKRVFRAVLYLLLAFGVAYLFREEIWSVVVVPVHEILVTVQGTVQVTELSEGFFATFKLCFVVAVVLASPGIFWELWGFIARGLHEHEKRPVRIYVPVAMFLFLEGCVFYYFVIQPTTLEFLLTFLDQVPVLGGGFVPIQQNIRLSDLVSFYLGMSLVIGLTFELPLVLIFLQKLGISNWRTYRRYRRHFLMAALVVMAILTPSGDMLTLGMCMLPVAVLYEGGVLVCWLMEPGIPAEPEEEDA